MDGSRGSNASPTPVNSGRDQVPVIPSPLLGRSGSECSLSEGSISDASNTSERRAAHRIRKMRRTWRESIKELEDEDSLIGLSADDYKTKCLKLQAKLRELRSQLLQANTEVTRLENAQITSKMTPSHSGSEESDTENQSKSHDVLEDAISQKARLEAEVANLHTANDELKKTVNTMTLEKLRAENQALSQEQEYRKVKRHLEKSKSPSGSSDECEHLPGQEKLMETISVLKTELNLLRGEKSKLEIDVESTADAINKFYDNFVNLSKLVGCEQALNEASTDEEKVCLLSQVTERCAQALNLSREVSESSHESLQAEIDDLKNQIGRSNASLDMCHLKATALKQINEGAFASVVSGGSNSSTSIEYQVTSLLRILEDALGNAKSFKIDVLTRQQASREEMLSLRESLSVNQQIATADVEKEHQFQKMKKELEAAKVQIENLESQGTDGNINNEKARLVERNFMEAFDTLSNEMKKGRDAVVAKELIMIKTAQAEVDFLSRELEPTDEELDELDKAQQDIDEYNEVIRAKEQLCVECIHQLKDHFLTAIQIHPSAVLAAEEVSSTSSDVCSVSTQEKERLETQIAMLASLNTELKTAIELKDGEVRSVREELDRHERHHTRQVSELEHNISLLRDECHQEAQHVGSLADELEISRALISDLETKHSEELTKLEQENVKGIAESGQNNAEQVYKEREDVHMETIAKLHQQLSAEEMCVADLTKDRDAIKLELSDTTALLEELKREADSNASNISSYTAIIGVLKKKLETIESEKENLQIEMATAASQGVDIESVTNERDAFRIQISDLESAKADMSKEIERLQDAHRAQGSTTSEYSSTIASLEAALTAQAADLNAKVANAEMKSLSVEESSKVEVAGHLNTIDLLESDKSALKIQIDELNDKLSKANSDNGNNAGCIQSLESQVDIESVTNERDAFRIQISDLESAKADMSKEIERLQDAHRAQGSTTSEYSSTIASLEAALTAQAADLNAKVDNAEMKSLSVEESSKVEVAGHLNTIDLLESDKSALKIQIDELNDKLSKPNSDNGNNAGCIQSLEAQVEALKAEMDAVKNALENAQRELDEKQAKEGELVSNFQLQIVELNCSISNLEAENVTLKSEVDTVHNVEADSAANAEAERDALKAELMERSTSWEAESSGFRDQLNTLRAEITSLHANISANTIKYETQVTELQWKIEVIESEKQTLAAERMQMQENGTDFVAKETVLHVRIGELEEEAVRTKWELDAKSIQIIEYQEQVKQHALTIVAIEERLNILVVKNKEYREEIERHREDLLEKESIIEEINTSENASLKSPRIIVQQGTNNGQTNQQSLVRIRRENANLRNQNTQAQKIIEALRRDINGLAARLSDVTGEVQESTKREIDEKRVKLVDADREIASHRVKVKDLFKIVEEKMAEIKKLTAEQKKLKEVAIKLKKSLTEKEKQIEEFEGKIDKCKAEKDKDKEKYDTETAALKEIALLGSKCRGERHEQIISNQREALTELRVQIKAYESYPRPGPSHDEALQQVMLLKKELAEIRARDALKETVGFTISSEKCSTTEHHLAIRDSFEVSAMRTNAETLELSESSYMNLQRAVGTALEMDELTGERRLAHIPGDEQLRLFREREQTCAIVANRIRMLLERVRRKEELLNGYEGDLAKLRNAEELVVLKEGQIEDLSREIRQRTEESQCLRHTLEKLREQPEPPRAFVTKLNNKKFQPEPKVEFPALQRSCPRAPPDPLTLQASATKTKEAKEKMKKKNYEINVLKSELGKRDHQLDLYKKQLTVSNDKKAQKLFGTPSPPNTRPASAKVRRARVTTTGARRPASAKIPSRYSSGESTAPPPSRPAYHETETLSEEFDTHARELEAAIHDMVEETEEVETNGHGETSEHSYSYKFKTELDKPSLFEREVVVVEDEIVPSAKTIASKVHFELKEDSSDF